MNYTENYRRSLEECVKAVPGCRKLLGKKVLITGGTGMIGSAVVELLHTLNRTEQAGITIYLAGRSPERIRNRFEGFMQESDYTFLQYDAAKSDELFATVDYIIHGACNASPSAYQKEPVETMLSNFLGVSTLLKLAVKNPGSRLLYLSSSEVYGRKEDNVPYEETDYGYVDILNPRACYPSAKRASETLCVSYGAEYGVDTVIVRPGHIYGPTISRSDTKASTQFTWNVVDGEDIVMKSAGDQLRSYCYTMDCASAVLAVLTSGIGGEAYNISNKNSIVTIRELAEALAQEGGRNIVFENPTDAEKKGYNLMSNSSLDAEKLEKLGWKAQYDLKTGVRQTLEVLKKQESEV